MRQEKRSGFHIIHGIRSEVMKMRGTFALWVHLALPLLGIVLFSLYYSRMQIWDPLTKASAYLQVTGIAYPFVIGVVCSGSIQLEENVGMQFLSGTGSRKTTGILLKLGTLLLMSFFSNALAVIGFGTVFGSILKQDVLGISFYFMETLLIFLSVAVLYLFHMYLSLQFSKAASIGAGIVETLIGALLLTGLGEGIWYYIPCAWASRFAEYTVQLGQMGEMEQKMHTVLRQELERGVTGMAVITVVVFLLFLLWSYHFEGRKGME